MIAHSKLNLNHIVDGDNEVPDEELLDLADDIDCEQWLSEINMVQYKSTFLVNLSSDGRMIRRKRLSQIRQQDLSQMNITNYVHQKRLMEHIRLVLKFSFNSPVRRKEIKPVPEEKPSSSGMSTESKDSKDVKEFQQSTHPTIAEAAQLAPAKRESAAVHPNAQNKKSQARRRRSFDSSVWNSISTSRKKGASSAAAANQLREGTFAKADQTMQQSSGSSKNLDQIMILRNDMISPPSKQRDGIASLTDESGRRWSFHGHDADSHAKLVQAQTEKNKALMYGNMALEYDIMLTSLQTLQTEYLNKFKDTINCEEASIFFMNDDSLELMLRTSNGKWYRLPVGSGIAGYCASTGQSLNIPDAYKDHRFNTNMDKKTGFKTRNILCHPVRSMRGGGPVIGVIQMLNKINANAFDANDEELLAACVQSVADVLSERFMELLVVASRFAGHAIFVGSKGGDVGAPPSYSSQTRSSSGKIQVDANSDAKADAK